MKAIMSEKGQITIPQAIRERLGLKAGQVLDFETKDGVLIARKSVPSESLDEVIGTLSKKIKDVDAYLKEARGSTSRKKGE